MGDTGKKLLIVQCHVLRCWEMHFWSHWTFSQSCYMLCTHNLITVTVHQSCDNNGSDSEVK